MTFRAAFFAGARLGLALTPVFAAVRGLPRLAEFPRRSFARFCTFDCFLRLAMIDPPLVGAPKRIVVGSKDNRLVPGAVINR